ncbi:MAG TPA: taurine dioxygenase, partial [Porticoccaceae bacterium]|nr:taurine dioxygenase [Porticoccaceae bacterium]
MNLKLISGALGAEVSGIDLTQDVPSSTYEQIRKLLVEH